MEFLVARLLSAFILFLTLTGCSSRDHCCDLYNWVVGEKEFKVAISPEVIAINEEIARTLVFYGVKIEKDRNLYVESSYAKRSPSGRFWIWMDLSSQRILDVPGTRRMMVNLVEGLLNALNSNPKLKSIQTFTPEDLYVSIELESFFGRYVDALYVGRAELLDGELVASYAHDCFDPELQTFHKHIEYYQMSKVLVAADDEARAEYKSLWDPLKSLYQEEPEDWETTVPKPSGSSPAGQGVKSTTTNKPSPSSKKTQNLEKALKQLNQ